MKKYNIWKKIIWLMTILWMALIFYFSHQPADISRIESGSILARLDLISKEDISKTNDREVFKLQLFIRKSAHVIVFSTLGALLTLSIIRTGFSDRVSYILAYISGTLYGIFDEIHQSFVPGRGPSFSDVKLDSLSVLAGVLITAAMIKLFMYFNSKKVKDLLL